MALIVEDGTGKVDSESYISEADADTYFTNRGNATWIALTTPVKEESLRKATDYMEQMYRDSWEGSRGSATQALSWPRINVYVDGFLVASDIVPDDVANACAELAFRASSDDLLPDSDQTLGPVIKEKVGDLEVGYSDRFPLGRVIFKPVDNMLSPYFKYGTGALHQVELIRA